MNTPVLKTENLCKKYRHKNDIQIVLDSVSLQIDKGDIYGLIGKNGAGKTTLLRAISGLIFIDGGKISLFSNTDFRSELSRTGFIIEKPHLYDENTAKENLTIYCKLLNANTKRISEVMSLVGLNDCDSKKVSDFSLGMKQRLSIAISLITIPEFLVLDEPLNGLDPIGMDSLSELIRTLNQEYAITFLISSHILSELSKVATRCGVINEGILVRELEKNELDGNGNDGNDGNDVNAVIDVDDVERAKKLLLDRFAISNVYEINNLSLKISTGDVEISEINTALVTAGIKVSKLIKTAKTLDEIFREEVRI